MKKVGKSIFCLGIIIICFLACTPGKPTRVPDYTTKLFNGDSVNLRLASKSKVTFINIWSTFCGPCLKEMPTIQAIYDKYRNNRDVAFFTIAMNSQNELTQFVNSSDSNNVYHKVFILSGIKKLQFPVLIGSNIGYKVVRFKNGGFSAFFPDHANILFRLFNFTGIPTTVIYNKNGQIVYKKSGVDMDVEGLRRHQNHLEHLMDSLIAL